MLKNKDEHWRSAKNQIFGATRRRTNTIRVVGRFFTTMRNTS